jgi:hypothetical protein
VEEEIQNFLRAVDSYPARVAKEPRVTFREHLSSISAARNIEVLATAARAATSRAFHLSAGRRYDPIHA